MAILDEDGFLIDFAFCFQDSKAAEFVDAFVNVTSGVKLAMYLNLSERIDRIPKYGEPLIIPRVVISP